ncbi:MAG TPA: FG-GAP repeat protein [Solirubrobacteraceae bacterium]
MGASVRGDFNGDGRADLAIGAPGETDDASAAAGAVHVLYGSPTGLTTAGSQLWTQDSPGVIEVTDSGDRFGAAIATGDFDGDGFGDLAVGVPGEDKGAGAVTVLHGSAAGITGTGSQLWSQGSSGIADNPEDGDGFGATLAAANFGGSAPADLAIGAPDEGTGTAGGAGVVHLMLGGTPAGLTATGSQLWSQQTTGIADAAEAGDHFGAALAAGALTTEAHADIAIGVPGEGTSAGGTAQGAVHVLAGSPTALTATGSQLWTQNSAGVADASQAGDRFGAALTIANFGGTTQAEVAIGVPGEDIGAVEDVGIVHILPGAASGPTATGSQVWGQNTAGVPDAAEADDRFGATLAAGNFGSAGQADLAVGAPGESVGAVPGAGVVETLLGAASGLTATGSQLWSQNTTAIGDTVEAGDHFGASLAIADYGNDAHGDLAIGVPDEDAGAVADVGIVQIIPGSSTGPTAANSKTFGQSTSGVAEDPEAGDHFGGGLGH